MNERELPTQERVQEIRERVAEFTKLTGGDILIWGRAQQDVVALLELLDALRDWEDRVLDFLSTSPLPPVEEMTEEECLVEIKEMGYDVEVNDTWNVLWLEPGLPLSFGSATRVLIFARRYLKRQKGEE